MLLLRKIDKMLNDITMYRLLLYGLGILIAIGVSYGYAGVISISGTDLLVSTGILVFICYAVNRLLAYIYKAAYNIESSLITALILACIMPPPTTLTRAMAIAVTGIIATASKYVISVHHKHVFNPAAYAALIVGLIGFRHASWWIGTPNMLPFVLVLGLLVTRKIRRFELLLSFIISALLMMFLVALLNDQALGLTFKNAFLSWPLVFFGTIMLTEPATIPPTRYYRILYGILVGALFSMQLPFVGMSSSPELALLLGNIFAYMLSSKRKLTLTLKEKRQLTPQVYDFRFAVSGSPLNFQAGQYLEWTLPHKGPDSRGNRRTFTIASSPTEKDLHVGIKFYEPSSTFKKTLRALEPGGQITAGQLAGDFTLPADQNKNLIFIAGGVGITPFISMLDYMEDSGRKCNATLFYLISTAQESAYKDKLEGYKALGLKVVYILGTNSPAVGWNGYTGRLTPEILNREVADYTKAACYISGPNVMVSSYKQLLRSMGLKRHQIITDYFAGY